MLSRLQPALPALPCEETAVTIRAEAPTVPSLPFTGSSLPTLPERLEFYRPIAVLGQGGMGTVYLVEDTRLGREVAIKTLRPELAVIPQAKERFLAAPAAVSRPLTGRLLRQRLGRGEHLAIADEMSRFA